MLKKIKNRTSLLKLAGIKEFITLEYLGGKVRVSVIIKKEAFYKLLTNDSLEKYEVIRTVIFNTETENLYESLHKFVKDNELEGINTICDVDQYRLKTLRVPKDVENIEEWLEENSSSILPEVSNSSEFVFAFEQIKEDEDYIYLLAAITRKALIEKMTQELESAGLIPLVISPSLLSVMPDTLDESTSHMFFQYIEEMLTYAFMDKNRNVVTGSFPLKDDDSFNENLQHTINLIKQNINLSQEDHLNIELSCKKIERREIKVLVENTFKTSVKEIGLPDNYGHYYTPISSVHKTIKRYGKMINLLEGDNQDIRIEAIEKGTVTRVTLAMGMFLFFMLAFITVGEIFLSDSIKAGNEILVDYEAKSSVIEMKQKENRKLVNDFTLLSKLKSGEVVVPEVMEIVSEIVGDNCYLTDLQIVKESDDKFKVIIDGVAADQGEVSSIVSELEYNENMKDVSLIYANMVAANKIKYNPGLAGEEFLNFKVASVYVIQK